MKKSISYLLNAVLFSGAMLAGMAALAADDPAIKGDLRSNIVNAMNQYIESQTIDGRFYLYDAVGGQLLNLTFDGLHKGIVDKNGFYVSCADFIDQHGRKIDVDILVRPAGDTLKATQAIVHSIDGDKRQYHLENE